MFVHSNPTEDNNKDFVTHLTNSPLQRYTQKSYSNSTAFMPPAVERSQSLQHRNNSSLHSGSSISYGSSIATRTASLLHTRPNNYTFPNGHMYNSGTMISHGSQSSQYNTVDNRHWSPSFDPSQRVREPHMYIVIL